MIKNSLFFLILGIFLSGIGCVEAPRPNVPTLNAPSLSDAMEQLTASMKPLATPDEKTINFGLTTESEIGKIEPLLTEAPAGLFVTIGGDRAFRAAALLKKIEALVIFDTDLRTVRFNQINTKLLKAKDLESYRHLRWNSSFKQWFAFDKTLTLEDYTFWGKQMSIFAISEILNRFNKDMYMNKFNELYQKINQNLELDIAEKKLYEQISQIHPCAKLFLENPLQYPLVDPASFIRYKKGNYLFDEELFQNLNKLALANKIFVIGADLSKYRNQDAIIKALSPYTIAVLDLDNGYLPSYIGPKPYERLVKGLLPYGKKESILITMGNNDGDSRYPKNKSCSVGQYHTYIGYTFSYINEHLDILNLHSLDSAFDNAQEEFNKNNWQDIKLFKN